MVQKCRTATNNCIVYIYITIYHTYYLLCSEDHVQINSNDTNNQCGNKQQLSKQNDKIAFILLSFYITTYHTYWLLYCKGNIHTFNIVILLKLL